MSALDNFLLNLPLPLIDHWGYLIVFISAIAEALPAIGSFFPGHTVVILSGFFAQAGVLKLPAVILTASAGAIIGDLLGYIIGRRYGHEFILRYGRHFFFYQEKYQATRQLVREHAGKTLVIGRFTAFARAFTPFIAGLSHVRFGKFIFYDIIGGLAWAATSILVGYLIGQGYEVVGKYFGRVIAAAIIAIAAIIFAYRFLDKRRHIFAKYHAYYLIINASAIYLFSKMVEDYFDRESAYRFDLWLDERIQSLWRPWLNKLMILISDVFSPEILLAAALALGVYYFFKKRFYYSWLIALSSTGGLALGALAKNLIGRFRPATGLVNEAGFSLPSQHALMALIFFACLMFFYLKEVNSRPLKYLFAGAGALIILLVGFSRVYLKVHYFSDVVAGWALGLFWFTFLILVFRITMQLLPDYVKKLKK